MKCTRCQSTVVQDEADMVADSFDFDFDNPICFQCAKEVWEDCEQSRTLNNVPCQDEGD